METSDQKTSAPKFIDRKLILPKPSFDSSLTGRVIDLDHLKTRRLTGTIIWELFDQLKLIMQKLESWESARMEGNITTLDELVESSIYKPKNPEEKLRELLNIDEAQAYVERHLAANGEIDKSFLLELHRIVVKDLDPEKGGSKSVGRFRDVGDEYVKVVDSKTGLVKHYPPLNAQVEEYMKELILFINEKRPSQFDLLVTAIAHHRFAWIHPFGNGNGRVVRLLTYAMLIKQGFNIHRGRIINPTAVFCENRDLYYKFLGDADTGKEGGVLNWCEYVVGGLYSELEKIDRLSDGKYVVKEILLPALQMSYEHKILTLDEYSVLSISVKKEDFLLVANDIKSLFPLKSPPAVSAVIASLKKKGFLAPYEKLNGRKYYLNFSSNHLFRAVIEKLVELGFVIRK